MKKSVIFWFDYPPKVEKGAFNEFTRLWDGRVFYVIHNDLRAERKNAHWDDDDFGMALLVKLYSDPEPIKTIFNLINDNPQAIHVLNGFDTPIVKIIKPYLFKKGINAVLFTERPAIMGNFFERILRRINSQYKYTKLYKQYKPYVKAILPLGKQGIRRFLKYGVPLNRMYNFMYCPQIDVIDLPSSMTTHPVRFLYVGRFYYKTKGTDVLMKAVKQLKGDWTLDLAGGYGADADEVLSQIEANSRLKFVGVWDSTKVVENMQNYDVVIVPSKADGWNLCVNEALHAGVSVITSDQAVSHEVIEKSGGGTIFKSNKSKELAKAMQMVIDKPEIVHQWSIKGREYVDKISYKLIGKYFYDIINYEFFEIGTRPQCPWQ